MLFALTGDVQIGKTRWLERLVDELDAHGVVCEGVLAPGVWRRRSAEEVERIRSGAVDAESAAIRLGSAGPYEKLGIDNVLLPGGERLAFARRRDLAKQAGSFDAGSQSARAQLGWEISDGAIVRVNAHFDALAQRRRPSAEAEGDARSADASATPRPRLLVVDELGRLELQRGEGLTGAMSLLGCGPCARWPHALIVVREWLVPVARDRFEGAWGRLRAIGPDEEGRAAVMEAF